MSVLNDALRKKNRERTSGKKTALSAAVINRNATDRRKKRFYSLIVAAALGIIFIGGFIIFKGFYGVGSAIVAPKNIRQPIPSVAARVIAQGSNPDSPREKAVAPFKAPSEVSSPAIEGKTESFREAGQASQSRFMNPEAEFIAAEKSGSSGHEPSGSSAVHSKGSIETADQAAMAGSKQVRPDREEAKHQPSEKPASMQEDGFHARTPEGSTSDKREEKARLMTQSGAKPDLEIIVNDTAAPFFNKAITYHRENRLDRAVAMYREVLAKNPMHYDALFNLASAYIEMGSYSAAYPFLEKCRRLKVNDAGVLLNMAVADIGRGLYDAALSHLNDADALSSGMEFEILLHRGIALSKLSRYPEAIACYEKAKKIQPSEPRLLFNMAIACDSALYYDGARKYYRDYLEIAAGMSVPEREAVKRRIIILNAYLNKR